MNEHHQQGRYRTGFGADKRPRLSPVVRIATGVVLMLFVGMLAGCNSESGKAADSTSASSTLKPADMDWTKQKAKETGGDFNKLSPEDQKRLTTLHGNQAPNILKGVANPTTDNF
jgi:hypothetical protein